MHQYPKTLPKTFLPYFFFLIFGCSRNAGTHVELPALLLVTRNKSKMSCPCAECFFRKLELQEIEKDRKSILVETPMGPIHTDSTNFLKLHQRDLITVGSKRNKKVVYGPLFPGPLHALALESALPFCTSEKEREKARFDFGFQFMIGESKEWDSVASTFQSYQIFTPKRFVILTRCQSTPINPTSGKGVGCYFYFDEQLEVSDQLSLSTLISHFPASKNHSLRHDLAIQPAWNSLQWRNRIIVPNAIHFYMGKASSGFNGYLGGKTQVYIPLQVAELLAQQTAKFIQSYVAHTHTCSGAQEQQVEISDLWNGASHWQRFCQRRTVDYRPALKIQKEFESSLKGYVKYVQTVKSQQCEISKVLDKLIEKYDQLEQDHKIVLDQNRCSEEFVAFCRKMQHEQTLQTQEQNQTRELVSKQLQETGRTWDSLLSENQLQNLASYLLHKPFSFSFSSSFAAPPPPIRCTEKEERKEQNHPSLQTRFSNIDHLLRRLSHCMEALEWFQKTKLKSWSPDYLDKQLEALKNKFQNLKKMIETHPEFVRLQTLRRLFAKSASLEEKEILREFLKTQSTGTLYSAMIQCSLPRLVRNFIFDTLKPEKKQQKKQQTQRISTSKPIGIDDSGPWRLTIFINDSTTLTICFELEFIGTTVSGHVTTYHYILWFWYE